MNRHIHLLAGLLLCTAAVNAGPVFSGFLNDPGNSALRGSDLLPPLFGDDLEIANNVALYEVAVALPGTARFLSDGFAAGGADPYFSIFLGWGSSASFLGSNFGQAFTTGGDFDLSLALSPGEYTISLGVFANMSFAENLGVGVLGDAFTGLGGPGFLGTSFYSIEMNEGGDVAVPEAALGKLIGIALCGLFLARSHCMRQ